jgi:hypothetical protein
MISTKAMKILLVDCDGTIRQPKSGAKFINKPDDQQPIPGAVEATRHYFQKDWLIVGITNQAGGWQRFVNFTVISPSNPSLVVVLASRTTPRILPKHLGVQFDLIFSIRQTLPRIPSFRQCILKVSTRA